MLRETYMLRAIELAKLATGKTNPNPLVGAVIVKEDRIIGEGYHRQIGDLHAERHALSQVTESPEGATIYVTLEPCCHYGKQPPCTQALIDAGIKKVVVGSKDPNPLVAGKGVAALRAAGIEVVEDYMEKECDAINPVFFHYIQTKLPYIALKYAMTADGKIATVTGKSQWITNQKAREHTHCLRNYYKGILVGIGTVLADNPTLTCRLEHGRNPIRIVCDTHLRIPLDCNLVKTINEAPLIIAYYSGDAQKIDALTKAGATLLVVSEKNGHINLKELCQSLGEMSIDGILVEGGGEIHASFLEHQLVNRIYTYIGGKIFGGNSPYTPVRGTGINEVEDSLLLTPPLVTTFGTDILLEYGVLQHRKESTCSQE